MQESTLYRPGCDESWGGGRREGWADISPGGGGGGGGIGGGEGDIHNKDLD